MAFGGVIVDKHIHTTDSPIFSLTQAVETMNVQFIDTNFYSYDIADFISFCDAPTLRASYRNPERARWAWYNRAHGSCPWPILDRAEDNAGECAYLDVRPLPPRTTGIMTKQARAPP